MLNILLMLDIFLSSNILNSFEKCITYELEKKAILEKQRNDFVDIENILFLSRLNRILDCFELAKNEPYNETHAKVPNLVKDYIYRNVLYVDVLAQWDYSDNYKPFLVQEDPEIYNYIDKDASTIPRFNENNNDIQHLYKMNKKINEIILKKTDTFNVKFHELKEMILNELKDENWNSIKHCQIFLQEKHIRLIVKSFCKCKCCIITRFKKDMRPRYIDRNDIEKMLLTHSFNKYEKIFRYKK